MQSKLTKALKQRPRIVPPERQMPERLEMPPKRLREKPRTERKQPSWTQLMQRKPPKPLKRQKGTRRKLKMPRFG